MAMIEIMYLPKSNMVCNIVAGQVLCAFEAWMKALTLYATKIYELSPETVISYVIYCMKFTGMIDRHILWTYSIERIAAHTMPICNRAGLCTYGSNKAVLPPLNAATPNWDCIYNYPEMDESKLKEQIEYDSNLHKYLYMSEDGKNAGEIRFGGMDTATNNNKQRKSVPKKKNMAINIITIDAEIMQMNDEDSKTVHTLSGSDSE